MDPNDSINNNSPATNPNFQQPVNPMPESTPSGPMMPMTESIKQPSETPPSNNINGQVEQNTQKTPRYVDVLPRICLALGIITIVGTILTILGFISGLFFSSQGAAMVSSLLLGATYGTIKQYGIILCVAALIAIFVAKNRYHISVKKPILIIICSIVMIYIPFFLLYFFGSYVAVPAYEEECFGVDVDEWLYEDGCLDEACLEARRQNIIRRCRQ